MLLTASMSVLPNPQLCALRPRRCCVRPCTSSPSRMRRASASSPPSWAAGLWWDAQLEQALSGGWAAAQCAAGAGPEWWLGCSAMCSWSRPWVVTGLLFGLPLPQSCMVNTGAAQRQAGNLVFEHRV